MKDLFSSHAGDYARYRPRYPQALFVYIYSHLHSFEVAWDCGTGNGQSATELAKKFKQVYATDISLEQLGQATPTNNVAYAKEPAERTSIADNSIDLITVSQALHWFDLDAFYSEVNRVAKKDAVIAAWTYNLLQSDEKTDALIHQFYFETLHTYWNAERSYVDAGYANMPFPYKELHHPGFYIETKWTLKELIGYLNTWSGLKKFIKVNKVNPLEELFAIAKKHWAEGEVRTIRFPLHLKIAKVSTFQKTS